MPDLVDSSSSLRVLSVYRTYFPDPQGGLQEAIRQICLATKQYRVSNRIFTLSPNPEPALLEFTEAQVIRRRSWAAPASCDLGGPSAVSAFRQAARESDLLHYFFPWPFADLLHCSVRPTAPAVMTYISDVVRQQMLGRLYAPLMEQMLRKMRYVVANAPRYVDTSPILSRPDIRKKVEIIPLGIDERSYPSSQDDSVFDRIGLKRGQKYFLFIGVLRYYKGLTYLLQAMEKLGYTLVIAGSGPEHAGLVEQSRLAQLTNVIFAGQVSDEEKLALLRNCLALVLPSHLRSEAFGMVLVEAAMCGKPMISCELGTGTSYVNQHRETGLVVRPASPEQLAAAMRSLYEDEAMALAFGKAARTRYERHFSGTALGEAYSQVFRAAAKA